MQLLLLLMSLCLYRCVSWSMLLCLCVSVCIDMSLGLCHCYCCYCVCVCVCIDVSLGLCYCVSVSLSLGGKNLISSPVDKIPLIPNQRLYAYLCWELRLLCLYACMLTYAGSKDVSWEKDKWVLLLVALHSGHKPGTRSRSRSRFKKDERLWYTWYTSMLWFKDVLLLPRTETKWESRVFL